MAQTGYHYIENYSNIGKIGISFSAISDLIKLAIFEIENIYLTKDPFCEVKDNILNININIKIGYGANINQLTKAIQERSSSALTNMCEINNSRVNVKIESIKVPKTVK